MDSEYKEQEQARERAQARQGAGSPHPQPLSLRGEGSAERTPGEMQRWAAFYAGRGWAVVPLRYGGKAPVVARWTDLRLDAAGIARHFSGGGRRNVGVLTGAASGGLVDVDCDAPEAAQAAAVLLPPTPMVSGRAGHPRGHYWYVVSGDVPRTTKYAWDDRAAQHPTAMEETEGRGPAAQHPAAAAETETREDPAHRGMLVELRANGCQTLLPPSLHPSGERVLWQRGAAAAAPGSGATREARPLEAVRPAPVAAEALRRAVGRVAAAALLARHWPRHGTRDETALALCGMLLRAGWGEEETDLFVRTVARIGGDEEWRERGKAKATRQRLDAGETAWGAPTLAQRLAGDGGGGGSSGGGGGSSGGAAAVVAQARAWLGIGGGDLAIERQALMQSHLHPVAENAPDGREWGILASEVDDAQVEWLWRERVPLGMLTLLDGDPGLGKSLITTDLIARVTTGREMPDGSPGIAGGAGVVLLSSEDSLRATIRPRLRAAGADLTRVLVEQTVQAWDASGDRVVERAFTLPTDLPLLRQAITRMGARLVVIDPLMAYLESRVNSWRDQDIRTALAPLARLAEETGAAIVILRHLNKSNGTNAIYRGGGSIGIIGAARSGLLVAKSPDDPERERVLTGTKSNLAAPSPSLGYRIETDTEGLPRIAWQGVSAYTATALLSAPAEGEQTAMEQAVAALRAALAAGPVPAEKLERRLLAEGISEKTYWRARKQLGVVSERRGFGKGGRIWSSLPPATTANTGNARDERDAGDDQATPPTDDTDDVRDDRVTSPTGDDRDDRATPPADDDQATLPFDDTGDVPDDRAIPPTGDTPCSAIPAMSSHAPTMAEDGGDGHVCAPVSPLLPLPAPPSAAPPPTGNVRTLPAHPSAAPPPTGNVRDDEVTPPAGDTGDVPDDRAALPAGDTRDDRATPPAGDTPYSAIPAMSSHAPTMAEDGGDGSVCAPVSPPTAQARTLPASPSAAPPSPSSARPQDDALVRALAARGLALDTSPPSAAACPKTGRAHQYALQRDVHYHPVCVDCGQVDLSRTVRDPADTRRPEGKERAR